MCTKYCCKSLNKQSSGVQERINPFYINSYGENSFGLRTFRFTNDLQERINFVNRGLTVFLNSCTCFRRCFRPSSGAYYYSYCYSSSPMLLLSATSVDYTRGSNDARGSDMKESSRNKEFHNFCSISYLCELEGD